MPVEKERKLKKKWYYIANITIRTSRKN